MNYVDAEDFEKYFNAASELYFLAIAAKIQEQLKSEERKYPVLTIRQYGRGKTGKVAGSPRDVIDSGKLYNSFTYKLLKSSTNRSCEYSYPVHYASLIYYGLISPGGYQVPPYPWVELAIEKLDLEKLFWQSWEAVT